MAVTLLFLLRQDEAAHRIRLIGELHTFTFFNEPPLPKPARSRAKLCESCQLASTTLYRVVADSTGVWKLVCPACRASVELQPFYRYGGTWKANKRH